MIIEKILNEHRVLHYSDAGMMIRQTETGNIYDSAEDNRPCIWTYEETDIPIPEEPATVEDKAEAYDILMGVSE